MRQPGRCRRTSTTTSSRAGCSRAATTTSTRCARWVDEVAAWPDDGPWLHHRELTDAGPQLCRTENFVPFHDGLRALLTAGPMLDTASALLGEPAVLYKEKINYKLPGGAGYSPHQDAPAYRFVDTHVSCMVAVDDALSATAASRSCRPATRSCSPPTTPAASAPTSPTALEWVPVEVRAGETLWFHSRTPHRSGPNLGTTPRRALYPTYNAAPRGRPPRRLLRAEGGRAGRAARRCRSSATSRGGRCEHRRVGRRGARALRALRRPHLRRGAQPARPRRADRRPGSARPAPRDEVVVGGAAPRRRSPPRDGRARRRPRSERRPPPRVGRCGVARLAVRPGGHRADRPARARQALPLRGRAGRTTTACRRDPSRASSGRAARWPPTRWRRSRPTRAGRARSRCAAGTTRPRCSTSRSPPIESYRPLLERVSR